MVKKIKLSAAAAAAVAATRATKSNLPMEIAKFAGKKVRRQKKQFLAPQAPKTIVCRCCGKQKKADGFTADPARKFAQVCEYCVRLRAQRM